MTARYFSAALLALALSAAANADQVEDIFAPLPGFVTIGEPASAEDAAAIRALFGTLGRGWGTGDAAMVASVYADDAEWMNAFGEIVRGADNIEAYLRGMWADEPDDIAAAEQTDEQGLSLRYVGDDAAIYHGVTRSTRAGALPGADHRRVHSTFVVRKIDGEWKVVHHHISDARVGVAAVAP